MSPEHLQSLSFQPANIVASDAEHIAASGKYREKTANLRDKYPNTRCVDWKIPPGGQTTCKVTLLEFARDALQRPTRKNFVSAVDLESFVDSPQGHITGKRRLYLVEGLHPKTNAILGEHFGIPPTLFVHQQRTAIWEKHHTSGNTPSLPSCHNSKQSFTVVYYEPRFFPDTKHGSLIWRCADGFRHISLSRTHQDPDHVGVVHRKASYWSERDGDGGWDALLFLDPPVREIYVGTRLQARMVKTLSEPYQGGYADFINYDNLDSMCETPGPKRESALEDLCHYWHHHWSRVDVSDSPLATTIFLKKIIASNYMVMHEYLRSLLSELEWFLSRKERELREFKIEWAEERWSDLQVWSRRCTEYIDNVEGILDQFGIPLDESKASREWGDCESDFHLISRKLRNCKKRSESLLSSFTGLTGMLGNRQAVVEANRSLHEARNVKILSFLGMLFLPLSFTASFLSMNGAFSPGARLFWVFFAIAFPLVAGVSGAIYLINWGYDEEGRWSVSQLQARYLSLMQSTKF